MAFEADRAVAAYRKWVIEKIEKRAADYERAGTADWSIPLKILAQELRNDL